MKFSIAKNYALFYTTTIIYSLLAIEYAIVVAHVPPDPATGGYSGLIFLALVVQVFYSVFGILSIYLSSRMLNLPTKTYTVIAASLGTKVILTILDLTPLSHALGIFLWVPMYILVPMVTVVMVKLFAKEV
jgi:hypothetical protein